MFKEALADPEHKDLKDWYRGPFDPTKPDARNLKANVKYSKTAQKALLRNWAVRVRDKARAFLARVGDWRYDPESLILRSDMSREAAE